MEEKINQYSSKARELVDCISRKTLTEIKENDFWKRQKKS